MQSRNLSQVRCHPMSLPINRTTNQKLALKFTKTINHMTIKLKLQTKWVDTKNHRRTIRILMATITSRLENSPWIMKIQPKACSMTTKYSRIDLSRPHSTKLSRLTRNCISKTSSIVSQGDLITTLVFRKSIQKTSSKMTIKMLHRLCLRTSTWRVFRISKRISAQIFKQACQ